MLTTKQKKLLAAHADCALVTVERVYAGMTTFGASYRRIEAAAVMLGLDSPPPQNKAVTGWRARAAKVADAS